MARKIIFSWRVAKMNSRISDAQRGGPLDHLTKCTATSPISGTATNAAPQASVKWMRPRRYETFGAVTLAHIRSHGCRDLLVYCESIWCNHSVVMNADWLPDDMPVRSLCPRMVCTACGLIGADVRPDWSPHTNRRPS